MNLYNHQKAAVEKLQTGSILVGGVGSGKSRTALLYFYTKVLDGRVNPLTEPTKFMDLYIITTARKRDTKEWDVECCFFLIPNSNIRVVIDSWNNIEKYEEVEDAFFIFDEQRVVGGGTWAKTFIKISRNNDWILLSATPGDNWSDYIPVFIANGYFRNRSEFMRKHVVYKPFMKYPVIDHYIHTDQLEEYRDELLVKMEFERETKRHEIDICVNYDKKLYNEVLKKRWNPWKEEPICDSSGLSQALRRVVNSDKSRLDETCDLIKLRKKVIIFYNFDYELEMLRELCEENDFVYAEWNGHKHEPIPDCESWVYLVQYAAGAEGWNCIETDTIIFYSQNHSYKMTTQAAGRIDRLNTPFIDLYYYKLKSKAYIDITISRCLLEKKDFNEHNFREEEEDEFAEKYGL